MPTPTPRAANVLPNTAPSLAPISNRVVTLGQTLSFMVSATDTDMPAQTLIYSLSGAPAGATIGYYSGLFSWTPASAPSTNTMSVIVSDNGTPSLSATQTFTVTVVKPPTLGGFTYGGSRFTFSWPTVADQTYRVEYKDNLNDPIWVVPADGVFTGTGGTLVYTNLLGGESPQRFYRVRLMP
jgi:hypothetical protein